jgi:site-specific recombinase XerD
MCVRSKSLPSKVLLADPDVRRWHENLARGSPSNADVNLRRLAAFTSAMRKRPADLPKLTEKTLHTLLLDFIGQEERRNVAGSYVMRTIIGVKSWLAFNGVRVARPIRIRGSDNAPTLRDERVPIQDELRAIFLAGTPRIRAACALIAHSGLRPEVLGNYLGNDGLTLGDFPELRIEKGSVRFDRVPAVVRVRPTLSKNSNGYLSFVSSEGCDYLRQYLELRSRSGEDLTPDSDLIHPDRVAKRFIRTINIGDAIRTAIRAAGFRWRPYVLRHYFDTQLHTAESKGKVAHDFRVYWMGHVGSIDARYTTNKRRLPAELVEEMRSAYQRCEPYLSTIRTRERDDVRTEVTQVLLDSLGYSEKDLKGIDLSDAKQVRALIQRRVAPSPKNQALVSVDELPGFLQTGWTFAGSIGADRVLLNPPRPGGPTPMDPTAVPASAE